MIQQYIYIHILFICICGCVSVLGLCVMSSPLAGNALANWHRSRWLPAQCSRQLATLSLVTSTILAIMGDGGPLGLAPPSSKPTVQEGGQRTHKNDFAVHQQILAAALQPAYFESDH